MEKYLVIGSDEGGGPHPLGPVYAPCRSAREVADSPAQQPEVLTPVFLDTKSKACLDQRASQEPLSPRAAALPVLVAAAMVMVVIACVTFEAQLVEDLAFRYVFQM
ncbi:hypothetical protein E2C01_088696 [Portunus trituberculatus]|uniref:Uncharacterized protein n=2 Tax=Portunus trituberculatus TaxID=210409 RepID=A0A5B7JGR3_PORTR|nr:hypothetical protein [Portunus trituberculatus]